MKLQVPISAELLLDDVRYKLLQGSIDVLDSLSRNFKPLLLHVLHIPQFGRFKFVIQVIAGRRPAISVYQCEQYLSQGQMARENLLLHPDPNMFEGDW